MIQSAPMEMEQAQIFALQALAYVAGDERTLAGLLAQTGIGPSDLRRKINDPNTLAGIMDYILGDEKLLIAMCDDLGISPEIPARARRALPGGATWD